MQKKKNFVKEPKQREKSQDDAKIKQDKEQEAEKDEEQ
jgi:hypothetical protein